MFTLEQKVDLVMRYIATGDRKLKGELKNAIIEALNEDTITKAEPNNIDVERLVVDLLKKIGMPPHLSGYDYALTAIQLCIADPTYGDRGITKRLYPDVAKIHNTTPSRVERAIRHATEMVFDRGDTDYIFEVFGNTMDTKRGKLTNSEFFAACSNEIALRMRERIV